MGIIGMLRRKPKKSTYEKVAPIQRPASANASAPKKPEDPVKTTVTEDIKPVVTEAAIKVEAKPNAAPVQDVKAEVKADTKPAAKAEAKPAAKAEAKPAAKAEAKPAAKAEAKPAAKAKATAKPTAEAEAKPEDADKNTAFTGKFEIKKSKDDRYVFNLYAANRVIVATSQIYSSSTSAMNGIKSVIENAEKAPVEDQTLKSYDALPYPKWEIYLDKGDQYRFRLNASNGSCICHSQGYTTKSSCKKGIESIIKTAKNAVIDKSYLKKEQ